MKVYSDKCYLYILFVFEIYILVYLVFFFFLFYKKDEIMIIIVKKNMLVGEFRFILEKFFFFENFKMIFLNVSYFDF